MVSQFLGQGVMASKIFGNTGIYMNNLTVKSRSSITQLTISFIAHCTGRHYPNTRTSVRTAIAVVLVCGFGYQFVGFGYQFFFVMHHVFL